MKQSSTSSLVMTQKMINNFISFIGICLNSLSSVIKLSNILDKVIQRNFNNIAQNEGYEILRYLLTAHGISFNMSSSFLIQINNNVHPSSKQTIEKFKGDILQALKDVLKENKIEIILRKSDVINPNNIKYLKCCELLANAALNHQLKKFGIYLPSDLEQSKMENHEIENLQKLEKEKTDVLVKEISAIKAKQLITIEEIKFIQNNYATMKIEINRLVEETIKNCQSSNLKEILINYSTKVDEMHQSNINKLNKLKALNQNLTEINSYIFSDRNGTIVQIDTKEFQISEPSDIEVISGEQLQLDCLLKILRMAIPQKSLLVGSSFENLIQLKIPKCKTEDMLEKYKCQFEKLIILLERNQSTEDSNDNDSFDDNWIKDHFIVVPQLNFQRDKFKLNVLRMDLYIDPTML